jgi:hypothetical protein
MTRAFKDKDHDNPPSSSIFICPILNRFECPYKKHKLKQKEEKDDSKFGVDYLVRISEIAFPVELVFATAKE